MFKKLLLILLALFVVFLGALFLKNPSVSRKDSFPQPTPFPTPETVTEDEMWNVVQKWRVSTNRKEYTKSETLCRMASIRLEEIKTDWSHKGFKRVASTVAKSFYFVGENLAVNFIEESVVLQNWLDSPSHRRNLENRNFQYSCIKTSGNFVVHIFGGY